MALCAGVMTLCAASSLFVACDSYDDSALREEIENLKGTTDELKSQLLALTARVDALYTLSFQVSSENKLEYSFDGGKTWKTTGVILATQTDVDFKVENKTLMYTEDGGKTWKSTGFTLPADVVIPTYDFKFKVENGKVMFTSDGKTWVDTGVQMVDPCTCPKTELVDNGDSVTIVIGDASFTIEKPEEIVFEIKAGKVYFASEGTEKITIKSSGIDDITVMSFPKGWYAEINSDGYLEITAPDIMDTEEIWNDDYTEMLPAKAAPAGYVKVHACSSEGKCMVGKLSVEVTAEPVVVKAYGGKYEVSLVSRWGFGTVYYGISEKSQYEADAKVLLDAMATRNWDVIDSWPTIANPEASGNIADVLGYEPELGKEYVVWAFTESYEIPTIDDLVLAFYSPINVTAVEDEAKRTPYDNYVIVDVQGANSYYALAVPSLYADNVEGFKEQMVMIENGGMGKLYNSKYEGSLYQITSGTNSYVGEGAPGTTGYLLILPIDGRPNDQYTVADIKSFTFTTGNLVMGGTVDATGTQVFESEDYDGEKQPIDPYSGLGVDVKASADTWKYFYFGWVAEEDYNLLGGDDEMLVDIIVTDPMTYYVTPSDFDNVVVNTQFAPGQTVYFVGFFLDENYKVGKLAKIKLTTKELVKSEMTLAPTTNLVDGVLKNSTSLEVTFNPSEPVSKYRYVMSTTGTYNRYEGNSEAEMADIIFFANQYTAPEAEVVDGKWTLSKGLNYGESYYIAVLPYDAEGNPAVEAYILEFDCVFEIASVITEASQFKSEPTIEFTIPANVEAEVYGDPGFYMNGTTANYELNYTVKPVAGTEVATLMLASTSTSYDKTMSAEKKASGLWAQNLAGQGYYVFINSTEWTSDARMFSQYNAAGKSPLEGWILVSWKDADGNYYFKEIDLSPSFTWMYNTLMGTETAEKPGTLVSPAL